MLERAFLTTTSPTLNNHTELNKLTPENAELLTILFVKTVSLLKSYVTVSCYQLKWKLLPSTALNNY